MPFIEGKYSENQCRSLGMQKTVLCYWLGWEGAGSDGAQHPVKETSGQHTTLEDVQQLAKENSELVKSGLRPGGLGCYQICDVNKLGLGR